MRVLLYNMCSLTWVSRGNYLIYIGRFSLLIYAFPLLGVSFRMCKKESPTFFGKKSNVFWKNLPRFWRNVEIFREMSNVFWGSAEHSLTISEKMLEKCSRNVREMMQVKEVFKGHKARFYDEMEQNTAKGNKKPQISFQRGGAKMGRKGRTCVVYIAK